MRADITWRVVSSRVKNAWQLCYAYDGKKPTTKKLGSLAAMPEAAAVKLAEDFLKNLDQKAVTVKELVAIYIEEELPKLRAQTQACYRGRLDNYILPRFGATRILDIEAYPVKKWLEGIKLAGATKKDLRSLLRILVDFAILRKDVPRGHINEITPRLCKIDQVSKKVRKARNLDEREYRMLERQLEEEPFKTMAKLRAVLGLRISECLALKWSDIKWEIRKIEINRSIVRGVVDDVKSEASGAPVVFGDDVEALLEQWRKVTEYAGEDDWIFASPYTGGREPWSYDTVYDRVREAGERAGLGRVSTHSLRHTHRSFLEESGASDEVQQKMMRHANLSTTKAYGDVYEHRKREAHDKVAKLVFGDDDSPHQANIGPGRDPEGSVQ